MRILVVEDEQKLAFAIKRGLETQKYVVDIALDGRSGLDLAVAENYSLIILDVMLPGIDGLQICSSLRRQNIHTPVIMLTAKNQVSDKVSGLDAGADDYLGKPFSFEELFARVRALSRRPGQITHEQLSAGDLALDLVSFQVTYKGKSLSLSTKEFAILEYLLRHKNIVIPKVQLITNVWNYDSDVMPNVVEVHIKHLRDKIDPKNPEQIIKTVRGRGYLISK